MSASIESIELVRIAAQAADNKKAVEPVALDVSEQMALADIFFIASADSERQVLAIAEAIEDELRPHGLKTVRKEGKREGRWVLLDFGDIVAHVMHGEDRAYYELERLWKDCPEVDLKLAENVTAEDPE